jgi:hypothetical protein
MGRRLLPEVLPQPGRLAYKCRTVIHVQSRSDSQTDRYSVQLTTLYDSNQRQSYIVNEVALAQALRYVQVPERIMDTSSTTLAKTTKLFILDVKPRSTAAEAGAQLVTAYGVDKTELTLPEEPRLNMLRSKFETRPGHLSNASVPQPEAVAHLVIGRDNPVHMPEVITRSIRGGSDLYFMRNDLFPGEMLYGETEKSGSKKKKAAGGPKTTSTPKPRNLPAASKKPEKAAQVRTLLVAKKRPNTAEEEQPTAGPSGIKDCRRQDSSPAISLAASDSMVSSLGRTTSATPVRDGGGRKKSISRERALIYARKSRVEETSSMDVARDRSPSGTRAGSPGGVARGNSTSRTPSVSPRGVARDSSTGSFGTASPRDVSRGSSTTSSRAASSEEEARNSSSSETEDSGSSEEDSDSNSDSDSGRRRLRKAEALVEARLAALITARKKMKEADQQIKKQLRVQIDKEKRKEELKSAAARRVEEEEANRAAAEAKAAEEAEASRKKLEADRLRDQQSAERKEEEKRKNREEARKRPEEGQGEARKRPEEGQGEARKRPEEGREGARKRPEEGPGEARKRPEEGREEAKKRPEGERGQARKRPEEGREEARKRPDEGREKARKRPEGEQGEARKRPEEGRAEARRRPEDGRAEAGRRPEEGRAEARERGASWEGRHVRERMVQDRLGRRQEEGQGRLSDPEETGLRPGYRIPRRDRPWRTTETPRDLPASYEGYVIAAPRNLREETAFQHLVYKNMLFRAPETGPDRCRRPHFRFNSGEPTPDSERTDRRRDRSPEEQEAARKRHRDYKD